MTEPELDEGRQRERALCLIPMLIQDIDYRLQGEEVMHFQLRARLHQFRSELESLLTEYEESFRR